MNSKVVKLDNVNSELGTKVSEKDNEIQKLKEEKEELEKENKGYE